MTIARVGPLLPRGPETTAPAPAECAGRPAFMAALGETGKLPPPSGAAQDAAGSAARSDTRPVGRAGPTTPSLQALLAVADAADRRVEALLVEARAGRSFTPAELLAMQAEVFRHAQAIEVLARTTDKLVGGLKQTLGTQV